MNEWKNLLFVEGLYCKRPIQYLASSKILTPLPPSLPGECVPPPPPLVQGSVPKKFRGISSERFSLFRGKNFSFRGIPCDSKLPIPRFWMKRNFSEIKLHTSANAIASVELKIMFYKSPLSFLYLCQSRKSARLFSPTLQIGTPPPGACVPPFSPGEGVGGGSQFGQGNRLFWPQIVLRCAWDSLRVKKFLAPAKSPILCFTA
jgi:hypothetical protein